jgi:predicted small metal-binding protein
MIEREMDPERLVVRCACGWETRGGEEEVVGATQEHGRRVHNMLATREEVLAMVVRAPFEADPAGGAGG